MPRKKEDWYTNIKGASEILNRNPRTISKWIKNGSLDGDTKFGNSTLIPISDVATVLKTSESTAVKVAKAKEVPLWKCKR